VTDTAQADRMACPLSSHAVPRVVRQPREEGKSLFCSENKFLGSYLAIFSVSLENPP
jgi:hypothetical protein